MIKFAFYGRVSTEDQQDPESSRGWQLTRSRALIEARDGVIVAEFFDVDKSRSIPWQRRPQATALLAELKNPNREFDAVVIGEPHRAFYGNQYGLTFPLFDHYGVPLWVPEVGGPIDPQNEAHDLVMSVFGGMSKGERNRIKIRVHSRHGRAGHRRGPVPRRTPALRVPDRGRGTAPQPRQGSGRQATAPLDLDPETGPGRPADLRRVHRGPRLLRHRRGPDARRHPQPVRARPRAQHATAAASRGTSSPSARSSSTPATPAIRSGTSSARTRCSSTSKTSRSATSPNCAGTTPASGSGRRRSSTRRSSTSRRFDQVQVDDQRARHRARRAQAAPRPAPVRAARLRLVRTVRPADAEPLGQRRHLLPVPVPRRVRARQPRRAPAERLPARRRGHRRGRQLARPRVRPAPPRPRPSATWPRPSCAEPAPRTSDDEETARKIAECDRKLTGYRATLDAGAEPGHRRRLDHRDRSRESRDTSSQRARPRPTRRMSEAEIKSIVDRLADIARVLTDADPERQGRDLPSARTQADLPPREEDSWKHKYKPAAVWVFR